VIVQQQALRDFSQAMSNYFHGTHRKPTWRKAGRDEGFRIVALRRNQVRRLNRHRAEVLIPKVGWVRFRWSRTVPDAKSFRVKLDRAGRWHVAFAAMPGSIEAPGTGDVVGVDRGVVVSAALSTGEMFACPRISPSRQQRLKRLQRKLARAKRGSCRRAQVRSAIARLKAREADARKDWAEKLSTDLARRFDVIRVEDLRIRDMTRSGKGSAAAPGRNVAAKSGLNRQVLASGWGILVHRLEQKAPGRVQKINPAYTSQRCSACGHVASENRKSQAVFACTACGFIGNADVNAALNIAAGHAVTARGGLPLGGPVNREPQPALLSP
jgi:transposase